VQLNSGVDEVVFGVGWFADADHVRDVVFFAFLDVEVQIVGAGCVHDEESEGCGWIGNECWLGANHDSICGFLQHFRVLLMCDL